MIYETNHLGVNDEFSLSACKNLTFPLHMHGTFEVYYLRRGETNISVGNDSYVLHPGECAVIFPHVPHSYMSEDADGCMCIFSGGYVYAFVREHEKMLPENPVFRPGFDFPRLPPENLYLEKAFLYSLLGELCKGTGFSGKIPAHDDVLTEKILSYIETNYTSPDCTLASVSDYFGYDYTYMSKFFSSHLHVGFRKFMNLYRIHKAQQLLRNEQLSVTEVAHAVGYSSVRNFGYAFAEITGTSPLAYRRKK